MDHCASREGLDGVEVHQHISYLAHKFGYQGLQPEPGTEISQWPTSVHTNIEGISRHLFIGSFLSVCCQNRGEILAKEQARLWTYESIA